ncbi:hypothetical protein ACFL6Y_07335 [Elusimicrobiota bacterium]
MKNKTFVFALLLLFCAAGIHAFDYQQAYGDLDSAFSSGAGFAMPLKTSAVKPGTWKGFSDKFKEALSNDPEVVCRREAGRNDYIKACLDDASIPAGADIRVAFLKKEYCGSGHRGFATKVRHNIIKEKDVITIRKSIYFVYKGKEKNLKRSEKEARGMVDSVERYYAFYGLNIEVAVFFNTGEEDMRSADSIVSFAANDGKTNAGSWGLLDSTVAIHEFGHLLGLDDEYPSGVCPARKRIDETSIMYKLTRDGAGRLYQRHIERILGPMCSPDEWMQDVGSQYAFKQIAP